MDESQWKRLMKTNESDMNENEQLELVNYLKHRQTFIKFKSNLHTYSRVYYLNLSEDAIHYQGSKRRNKREACKIKDIDEIRRGFTTATWKKCIKKGKIKVEKENLAFSILYHNNRHSIDLLAETDDICSKWIRSLEYLINRYRSHIRTHHEITQQWIWVLFSHADRDHSGALSRREVRRLLFTLNIELEEHDIDKYFSQSNIRKSNYQDLKNLDKDEFLIFYKFISHRPELLKIICRFNGSTPKETADLLNEYNQIDKLPNSTPIEYPRDTSTVNFEKNDDKNICSKISCRQTTSIKQDTSLTLADIEGKKNYLTTEQLKDFLQNEQHMNLLTIEDCSKLIARFEPSSEGKLYEEMGIDGLRLLLLHDEFCIMNTNKSLKIYQDMKRPITDYFIATSHNTYLRDNQVYGSSTPETYIHALRTGCRAVELDCYDGDDMEPLVYHGNTLTKSITFREIIVAIETQAFARSPYPLFLNIENHCSYEQQGIMARILKDVFKERLLTEPLINNYETLPSPEDLKYKVLIRSRRYPKGKIPSDENPDRNNDGNEIDSKAYNPEFANLIIYSQIISFTNVFEIISTQKCFHSVSLKESKADDLINADSRDHLDLISLTKQHIARVYPGTKRQDSSNINPMDYWIYGVQMVALNYQSNDESMRLQHGFFSDNGGCGYLLKPDFLLTNIENNQSYDPKEKFFKKAKRIQIHIISGQHLPKEKHSIDDTDIIDPFVEICTYGIKHDSTKHRTPSVRNNGLNPVWDHKINVNVYCPELCLILFEVRDEDRFGRSKFIGQACIPFTALQLGYRHVKLKAKNGDYIHGTLFVHINITDF